jgi:pimeloyl-ACP methyl ester carboxylesterase
MNGEVVLVPGLWMPAAIMLWMGARLAQSGYRVHRFAYSGREPLEANLVRLARFARESCAGAAHFVGHSLGGVLIHDLLERDGGVQAARVVLVGAPVRGCLAGRRLAAGAAGRWLLGGSAARWESCEARWRRPEALGVIAGTLPLGLGRMLGALPGDNDGVVRVEETAVEGMAARVLLREPHSLLAVSDRVAALVARFLRAGQFS